MKKLLALAIVASAVSSLHAQGVAGSASRLTGAFGLVSVSQDGLTRPGGVGTLLGDGATVVVPSRGSATIQTANGCTVSLRAGQAVTLNSRLNCSQLSSSISQGPIAPAAAIQTAAVDTGVSGGSAAGGSAAGAGASSSVAASAILGTAITLGVIAAIVDGNRSNRPAQISAE